MVHMSASPVDEISLLPQLVNCLPAADGLPIEINISKLIRDMIERFFKDHPSETAHRNFRWSIYSKDLPTFVFDFIRTHDCFHAGPNVVVTYPVHQYTDGVLFIVANLEWQGQDTPKVVRQGDQYCIECPPAKSNSSAYWGSPGFKFSPTHIDYTTSKTSPTIITTVIAMHFPGNVQHLRISRYKIKEPTSWVLRKASNTVPKDLSLSPKKRKASRPTTPPATIDNTPALDNLEVNGVEYLAKRRKTGERFDTIIPVDLHFEHVDAVSKSFFTDPMRENQRLPFLAPAVVEEHSCLQEQDKINNNGQQRRDSGTGSVRRQFRSLKLRSRTTPIFSWNLPVREKKSSSPSSPPESPLSPVDQPTIQHHPLSLLAPSPPGSKAPAPPDSPDTEASSGDSPTTETTAETTTSVPSQEEIQTNYKEFEERKMSAPEGFLSPTAAEWDKWWYDSGEGESGFSGLSGIESGSDIDKSAVLEE